MTRILEWPSVVDAVLAHLPASASAGDRQWVRSVLAHELPMRCLVTPLISIGGIALFSALLHIMGRSQRFPQRPRYVQLFAVTAYAALIPASLEFIAAASGVLTGTRVRIPSMFWLDADPGGRDFIIAALLEAVNVASLWYVIALAAALAVLFTCSTRRSLLFAATAWAMSVLANLWLLRIMIDALRLRI